MTGIGPGLGIVRIRCGLKMDERVIAAIKEIAEEGGLSFNAYIETVLFSIAKGAGKLEVNAQPLPETRGAKRKVKTAVTEEV